jgi:hypothetical protein
MYSIAWCFLPACTRFRPSDVCRALSRVIDRMIGPQANVLSVLAILSQLQPENRRSGTKGIRRSWHGPRHATQNDDAGQPSSPPRARANHPSKNGSSTGVANAHRCQGAPVTQAQGIFHRQRGPQNRCRQQRRGGTPVTLVRNQDRPVPRQGPPH